MLFGFNRNLLATTTLSQIQAFEVQVQVFSPKYKY